MRGCILLFGESFRLGKQFTRNIGSEDSYQEQILASKSHLKFIQQLPLPVDVYLSSYTTKYTPELIQLYQGYLVYHKFYDSLIGQVALVQNTLRMIQDKYKFILILRIDLFLKPYFSTVFNPSWDKIMCNSPFASNPIIKPLMDTLVSMIPCSLSPKSIFPIYPPYMIPPIPTLNGNIL